MKKARGLYVIGALTGLCAVLLLVPRFRATLVALVSETLGRARQAWREGKREMERREHELELEVRGRQGEGPEEPETPDYIV